MQQWVWWWRSVCYRAIEWTLFPPVCVTCSSAPENSSRWSLLVSVAVSGSKMITVLKQTYKHTANTILQGLKHWTWHVRCWWMSSSYRWSTKSCRVTLLMSNSRGLLLCSSFLSTTLFTFWWRAASSQSEQSWNFCVRLELDTEFILYQHKGIDQHAALSQWLTINNCSKTRFYSHLCKGHLDTYHSL